MCHCCDKSALVQGVGVIWHPLSMVYMNFFYPLLSINSQICGAACTEKLLLHECHCKRPFRKIAYERCIFVNTKCGNTECTKSTEVEPASELPGNQTAGKFWRNKINIIVDDSLAPCIARLSANLNATSLLAVLVVRVSLCALQSIMIRNYCPWNIGCIYVLVPAIIDSIE